MRLAIAAVLLLLAALSIAPVRAADHRIGGTVNGLLGSGLRLELVDTPSCVPDGGTFTLTSTERNDCFIPSNLARCCSNAISATAFNPPATVTCTCGLVIIPRPLAGNADERRGAQSLTLSPGAIRFVFPTPIPDRYLYSVRILAQPTAPAQQCVLSHADGQVNGRDVGNVFVSCAGKLFANGFEG